MHRKKFFLGLTLFIIGFIGVLSTLTMELNLPPETQELLDSMFTPVQIQLLMLVNPSILLLIAVVLGTIFFDKTSLRVPIIEKLVGLNEQPIDWKQIMQTGIGGGVVAGVLLTVISMLFDPILPEEFQTLGESVKPTLAARFLYGGFTEEILMRFGLMSFLVWILSMIFGKEKAATYWVGIIITAILFAVGHFPVAFQAVGDPSPGLLTYIVIGNSLGGIIFGWLYWKRGLESAFLAHIFAHVVMVSADMIMG